MLWNTPFFLSRKTCLGRLTLLCAGRVGTKLCAFCGSYWSRLAFRPPECIFFEKHHHNNAAEPRVCLCRSPTLQRVIALRSGLGSGWSGPTCKVEIDDSRPAQRFGPTSPAHSGSHLGRGTLIARRAYQLYCARPLKFGVMGLNQLGCII